ncbi:MAG TPA: VOC family protein [Amycolatopsis sp.]|uniref:VOC family protein n=1 Tax=Amycolatopsis sp. TaxID=37632 RepID=UPI002B49741F|nr:VOC family protein [Amycolatopsis sp.]HKS47937.1 VOC family protein [Amycolatopsis sp.]
MVVRDTPWPEGTPSWVDVMVPDTQRAAAFYSGLFGWQPEDQGEEYGHYQIASLEGKSVAAIGPKMPGMEGVPSTWTTYLSVADVDKTAAKITEAGGQLMMPPGDVGDAGRMAVAADPAGAVFGLWQAREMIGIQLAGIPGTLVWNECMTRDFDGAKAFYAEVFGYRVQDMSGEGFRYVTLNLNDRPIGGLGAIPEQMPAETPSHWAVYFGVSDTDAAAARIQELGGSVLSDPQDTPYGRMAQVTDDQGVPFSVISVSGE